jgi:hypothetical protein
VVVGAPSVTQQCLQLAFGQNGCGMELREYWHLDEGHAISAADG